ncbi:flavin reductase family protein [Microbacterium sp. A196]|uniref:flavin reductase family protein n=1 Tax=Microbacterium sp. A196 TaxID=3457320 RepID=UPI003FD20E21
MVFIEAAGASAADQYRYLNGSIIPRPIAWVTTGIPPEAVNLAPFSSFTWVSQYPAMLGFCVQQRRDGTPKDTKRLIEAHGEYVIHIARFSEVNALHASSERFGPDESEVERVGLELAPSSIVKVPRLAAAAIAMEMRLHSITRFSETGGDFIVGSVLGWHLHDDILVENGRIDSTRLQPLARLGGPRYTGINEIVELPVLPQ